LATGLPVSRDFGAESPDIAPFLQAGIGATYLEDDDRRGDDDDSGFLFAFGGGVEARLTDELSLTSLMEFNVHPDDVLDVANADALDLATLGGGLGTWHLYNGRPEQAREIFRKVVATDYWPSFGFIAAEVELAHPNRPR